MAAGQAMPSDTWYGTNHTPPPEKLALQDWVRVILRAIPLVLLVFGGLVLTLLLRLIEAPLFGQHRPVTPHITVAVCRGSLAILGLRYVVQGTPLKGAGAIVANHSSWLDIFALNAAGRVYFVSKAEVAQWPGIGWLARATGTVFIQRDRRQSADQVAVFRQRLEAGHKLLFFPEGTSTDGLRVLAFKPTLFAAFFDDRLRDRMQIQPVTLQYRAPAGADPRLYGWWGDMEFGPHLLTTLAARKQGQITVKFHAPVAVAAYSGRKALAAELELTVRGGLTLSGDG